MYITRIIDIKKITSRKSVFLLGPRQTGKSTFLRHEFPNAKKFSFLLNDVFLRFSQRPSLLRELVDKNDELIVIDEIQRLPEILNEVHYLIEEFGLRFVLTGSSARKLRKGGVNLLGGRASQLIMHPFVRCELADVFDLKKAINVGLLPSIYFSKDPKADLDDYLGLYLKEEIAAEALTRNIQAFSRFLLVAALSHGKIIELANIANDAQVPRTTVAEYFLILEQTLFGRMLHPWRETIKRKSIAAKKFYFFDNGVVNRLLDRETIKEKSPSFGDAFEAYIFHELDTYVDYSKSGSVHYWRSTTHFEVDFILNGKIAIEVRAKKNVGANDLKGLMALKEENILQDYCVVSLEGERRTLESGIIIYPWEEFLDLLWSNKIV